MYRLCYGVMASILYKCRYPGKATTQCDINASLFCFAPDDTGLAYAGKTQVSKWFNCKESPPVARLTDIMSTMSPITLGALYDKPETSKTDLNFLYTMEGQKMAVIALLGVIDEDNQISNNLIQQYFNLPSKYL